MAGALHNVAEKLINDLGSRGITIHVSGDRLEVGPKSLLTDDDRGLIRSLKQALIAMLAPCVSHVDSAGWERTPLDDRPGWERADCRRCGRFIGCNPIGGLKQAKLRSESTIPDGGDGGDGGDPDRYPRGSSYNSRIRDGPG